jgi:hypothetical protein
LRRVTIPVLALLALAVGASPSMAASRSGVQHLHFHSAPFYVIPGANQDLFSANEAKPNVDGYITRMAPNLRYAKRDGTCCAGIPRVDVIHLHHAVWTSNGRAGRGNGPGFGGFYPFMAAGEEKTITQMPPGFGYAVGRDDVWALNYMIHNLTSTATRVYLTYDIDFIPATSPAARSIRPVYPVWNDVESGHIYPVFDVKRGSGRSGRYTFPDQASDPYGGGPPLNQWRVRTAGTLIGTAGHIHPGGLWTELDLLRPGATVTAASRRAGVTAGTVPNSVRLFRSYAHYWDKRGPISWDMAMTATPSNWRVRVRPGDTLRVSATYETRRASWYESMGIMVAWMTHDRDGKGVAAGVNPFRRAPNQNGKVTHGHLAENNHHGGSRTLGSNAVNFPICDRTNVAIGKFLYRPGDFRATGVNRCLPTVREGSSLTFTNFDAKSAPVGNFLFPSDAYKTSVFHTITSCQSPCGLDTGISYPLANGPGNYDSAQLGFGVPTADRLSWSTPATLRPGTYTYFCRIHPFMRGAFRVVR